MFLPSQMHSCSASCRAFRLASFVALTSTMVKVIFDKTMDCLHAESVLCKMNHLKTTVVQSSTQKDTGKRTHSRQWCNQTYGSTSCWGLGVVKILWRSRSMFPLNLPLAPRARMESSHGEFAPIWKFWQMRLAIVKNMLRLQSLPQEHIQAFHKASLCRCCRSPSQSSCCISTSNPVQEVLREIVHGASWVFVGKR